MLFDRRLRRFRRTYMPPSSMLKSKSSKQQEEEFHMPTSDGSIVIAIKSKDKQKFRSPAMFLFYIL